MTITVLLDHSPMPADKMTSDRAHAIMQVHIDCLMEMCGRKRQAKGFLIEHNQMVPDVRHACDYPGL